MSVYSREVFFPGRFNKHENEQHREGRQASSCVLAGHAHRLSRFLLADAGTRGNDDVRDGTNVKLASFQKSYSNPLFARSLLIFPHLSFSGSFFPASFLPHAKKKLIVCLFAGSFIHFEKLFWSRFRWFTFDFTS